MNVYKHSDKHLDLLLAAAWLLTETSITRQSRILNSKTFMQGEGVRKSMLGCLWVFLIVEHILRVSFDVDKGRGTKQKRDHREKDTISLRHWQSHKFVSRDCNDNGR